MKFILKTLSYILVATLAALATMVMMPEKQVIQVQESEKISNLLSLIEQYYIAEADPVAMEDGAAAGIVDGLEDRWSYYIPASDYQAYQEQSQNAYVGVGITIVIREDGSGIDITKVEPNGPAARSGILPGDVLIAADGQPVLENGLDKTRDLVKGEEGTTVDLTVLRDGKEMTFTVTREQVQVAVTDAVLLEGHVGLISIYNFDARCADETISSIQEMISQGADSLIFDVRFNPGGYKHELVAVLDFLLPEGELFRAENYDGSMEVDYSDKRSLDIPMAVLVNGDSYSAAEFFAAALDEYEAAVIVGEQTSGKGYFQQTFQLGDGSAVALSTGRYTTPNGVSLEGVGITPDVIVEVEPELAGRIYSGLVPPEEDPQIIAAINALKSGN